MNRFLQTLCAGLTAFAALPTPAAEFKFNGQTLTVPDGFEVELVATTNMVRRPVSASFDEQGRLYLTDSSGSNAKLTDQLLNPDSRIVRLEDTDGDGKFDKSVVFADKVMFPEGCLYYDGSVYMAGVPSIWKFTDTNGDGLADKREEWHKGQTLTGCGNDLHGPFLGLDGWIYWCKGASAEQTYQVNGKPFTTRAAHIWRKRPDGTGIEPVLTGGMDNPVGVAFTPEGERILCGTFFAPHEPGHRDGLNHAIYGGVYGKINNSTDGHKRTGELMPVMTHMGPAAPAAVTRYESRGFSVYGDEYRDNLFCAQFNKHKVSRHILVPDGATFKTIDSDFLVSDNPDFHPTDIIEDADGSLLIIDTGAWYKLCCPTSQLAKPDVLGAIYRVRRKGAKKITDPLGLKIAWGKSNPTDLANLLADERIFVQRRAMDELAKRGKESLNALAIVLQSTKPETEVTRLNAIWCLTRIDDAGAREVIARYIYTTDTRIAIAATHSASVWRDASAERKLSLSLAGSENPAVLRATAEALGRLKTPLPAEKLLRIFTCPTPPDRVLEHSAIYALIEAGDPADIAEFAKGGDTAVRPAALVALDQMNNGGLKPELIAPLLASPDAKLRKTAMWIALRHPEWGSALAGFFRERLAAKNLSSADLAELENQLDQFASNAAIQNTIADAANGETTPAATGLMLLRVIAQSSPANPPRGWANAVTVALGQKDDATIRVAITAAQALGRIKNSPPNFSEPLQRIANDSARPDDLRLSAMAALPRGLKSVEPGLLKFLLANLDPSKTVAMRSAAASVLIKATLTSEQLLQLADTLKSTGPLEVSRLLAAFERTTDEAVGLKLVAGLKESKGVSGVRPDLLKALAAKYPAAVQSAADELLNSLNADAKKQGAHVDELLANLPKGEIRNGQLIFNSPRAACSSCHKMGYAGGTVGPDLTKIGEVRTERDLIEAIVYPSASFVRSYEPFIVHTKADDDYSGVLRSEAAEEIILATGPNADVRVARSDITDMRPGTVSVMPGGLDQLLTKQELADLVTFLKNTKWGPN